MHLSIVKHYSCLLQDLDIDKESHDYLIRRLKSEGPRFLSVILPSLWKVVLTSIERGFFDFEGNTSFARKKKLPKVFFGLFCKIFSKSGKILDIVDPTAVLTIRQACEYYYKCSFAFSANDIIEAEEKFLSTEVELSNDKAIDWGFVDNCRKSFETYYDMSDTHVQDVLAYARPRFGPGSMIVPLYVEQSTASISTKPIVSKKGKVVETIALSSLTNQELKLAPGSLVGTCNTVQAPYLGFFKAYPRSLEETLVIEEGRKTEVLFVPKDSRGPRVISREPMHLLRMQMSFLKWGCDTLERVTDKRINFADQSINRELAREGSLSGSWDTFDLKEASDRIRHSVAAELFKHSYAFRFFISKCRSTHFELPSTVGLRKELCKRLKKRFLFNDPNFPGIKMNKLSGMGSGITFPILALTIHLAVCTEVQKRTGAPYQDVMKQVYVYGDDLIVPNHYSSFVKTALSKVGLLLNQNKSFLNGPFRESCGGDYVNGVEVSPVRLKLSDCKLPSIDKCREVLQLPFEAVASLERHSRELVKKGLTRTANYLYSLIEKALGVALPVISGEVNFLGRYTTDWEEPFVQDVVEKVYYPSPVSQRTLTPCPYKHLQKVLTPNTARETRLYELQAKSAKRAMQATVFDHSFGKEIDSISREWLSIDVQDSIDEYLGNVPRMPFGQYDLRYTKCIKVRKNVPAFCLTGRPLRKEV